MNDCPLGDSGVCCVARAVAHMPILHELCLNGVQCKDGGANAIASALEAGGMAQAARLNLNFNQVATYQPLARAPVPATSLTLIVTVRLR